MDKMDREKEIRKKISVELHYFQEEDAIWLMMDVVEEDDFITMEKITGKDYGSGFYDEDKEEAEYEEQIHCNDYINSLSCEELKENNAKNAKVWERYNTDNNVGWSEWCNQRIKDMENELIVTNKDGTESTCEKSNISDDHSVGSEQTCETESTDTLSTSLDQHNMDNCKTDIIEQIEEHKQVRVKSKMIDVMQEQNLKREINCNENCIATALFLDLRASLEDLDNHKEKPLTCDMEPDIQRNQQWKLIHDRKKLKKNSE